MGRRELRGISQGEFVLLGVCSSVAAVGSVYCNGVVVEQPTLGRYSHLVGNANVLEVGVIHKHTFAHGGDGIGHLEGDVCLSSGIDQKLSHIAVVEYAILRGKGGVTFGHLELLQASKIAEGIVNLVDVFQAGGEGDTFEGADIGPITYIAIQCGGGKAPEVIGNVQGGRSTCVVGDSNTVMIGEHVVPLHFLDAVAVVGLMTLAKLCYIGAHYIPGVGGVYKDPSFCFRIGHVPGVAAAGGIAVDQDTGNAQIGEHGLGQVGIGLTDSFLLLKGGIGVLICNIGRICDVMVDKVLNLHHFLVVISNAVGDLQGFCTDLIELLCGDDNV